MATHDLQILCWNVRGLNSAARRQTVQQIIASVPCNIVCLQETKLSQIDDSLVRSVGGRMLRSYSFLPAGGVSGTRGGILILWNDDVINIDSIDKKDFSLTANVTIKATEVLSLLTVVYGPTREQEKPQFLQEIRSLAPRQGIKWIILGDFNQIYKTTDKNNSNLNINNMRRFRDTLNNCDLKEIHLQNRKYTWSNERRNPTLV